MNVSSAVVTAFLLSSLAVQTLGAPPSVKKSDKGFQLHVTTDFFDDLVYGYFDEGRMREMMRMFRSWGVSRVYWLGDTVEEGYFSNVMIPEVGKNAQITHQKIGEFIPAAVKYAHEAGMELYVEYKPFDRYIPALTPYPEPKGSSKKGIPALGGRWVFGATWLEDHTEYLLARNMTGVRKGIENEPVGKIVFVKKDDKPTALTRDNLELYVSADNIRYHKYDKPYSFANEVVSRAEVIKGCNLNRKGNKIQTVRIITLSGLDIREPYFAISTQKKAGKPDFENDYFKLAELYTARGEPMPFTYGVSTIRNDWLYNYDNPKGKRFPEKGFSFGTCGYLGSCVNPQNMIEEVGYLDPERKVLGFAKGVMPYIPALCPVYPEVKEYWLSRIRKFIDWGVDGVDLRWPGHQDCQDWDAYGFNPPVVEEYKKQYGVDIRTQTFDRDKWRRLMGEHYTQFYRQAKTLLAKHGKKMQVDVLGVDDPVRVPPCQQSCNVFHDWEQWFTFTDEILLRRYLRDFDIAPFLNVARKRNLPAYYSVWSWMIWTKETPDQIAAHIRRIKDQGTDGLILYEGCALYRLKPDGTFYQPRADLIEGTLKFFRENK